MDLHFIYTTWTHDFLLFEMLESSIFLELLSWFDLGWIYMINCAFCQWVGTYHEMSLIRPFTVCVIFK